MRTSEVDTVPLSKQELDQSSNFDFPNNTSRELLSTHFPGFKRLIDVGCGVHPGFPIIVAKHFKADYTGLDNGKIGPRDITDILGRELREKKIEAKLISSPIQGFIKIGKFYDVLHMRFVLRDINPIHRRKTLRDALRFAKGALVMDYELNTVSSSSHPWLARNFTELADEFMLISNSATHLHASQWLPELGTSVPESSSDIFTITPPEGNFVGEIIQWCRTFRTAAERVGKTTLVNGFASIERDFTRAIRNNLQTTVCLPAIVAAVIHLDPKARLRARMFERP